MPLYEEMSEEMAEELGKYVTRKWEESKKSSLRAQVISDAIDARNAYDQIPSSEELWDDAINLVLPFLSISVDQLEPRLVASIAAHDRLITIDDKGEMDEQLVKDIETMDNAVLKDDVGVPKIVKSHIHNILLDGHVFVAPYWDFREGKVREWVTDEMGAPVDVPEGGELPPGTVEYAGKMMVEKIVKTRDQAAVDELDSEMVFIPDRIDDWETAPIIYEYYMSWGEFLAKQRGETKGWVPMSKEELGELRDQLYTKRPDIGKQMEEGEEDERGDEGTKGGGLKSELRLLQAHIDYDVDEDGIEEKVIVTIEEATQKIVYAINNLDLDPLNRKQIRVLRLMKRYNSGYGYSLYSKLKMIQEGGSDTTNIMLNSSIIQMMPFFFYEEATGFNTQEIELFPGAGIQVGDVKRILMNSFQPNAGAFKDIIEIFFRLWNYIVTLPDYSLGREPTSEGSTATGVLSLLQEASIAHDYMGGTLHDQYTELFQIIHDLCYLNISPAREMATLGRPVQTKVLSNSYKISLVASSKSANRHVERMELGEALEVAKEGVNLGVITPDAPIRDYLETFKGVNVERWMNGPLAQVFTRMREALNAEGKGADTPPDPFGDIVMNMLGQSPAQLTDMMQAATVGAQVKDEVTGALGGQPQGSGMEGML